jgi:DMSO/TMAO reductase YedYZ molybdopterin-dependent catalytic subunit
MKSIFCRLISGIWIAALAATVGFAQTNEAVLSVSGAVGHPLNLSLAELRMMPRYKFTVHQTNQPDAVFEGAALDEVVNASQPVVTRNCCSNVVNTVVVVKAMDNYQAAFLLTELDPKFGHQLILLADTLDGHPLQGSQGPLQVIVPEDKMHARWVRRVDRIEILHIGRLTETRTKAAPH